MDFNGIDLNLLVAFDALMSERSVTKAGRRIGRTQPAMSAALSRLRALLKDELFIRGQSGLQPTARAVELAEPLSRALSDIQRTLAFTQDFDPTTSGMSFTLGLSDHPAYVLLPKLVQSLSKTAPGLAIRVVGFSARDDAISLLDSGQADITIGVPASVTPGGRILTCDLFREQFISVVRKNHPILNGPVDLKTFLRLSHLLVSPEQEGFGVVDAALSKKGLKRRIAITLPQMYAAPMLVSASDMIATLMEGIVSASGVAAKLAILKPPVDLPEVNFNMYWHRRNDAHPAQCWLRERISTQFSCSHKSH